MLGHPEVASALRQADTTGAVGALCVCLVAVPAALASTASFRGLEVEAPPLGRPAFFGPWGQGRFLASLLEVLVDVAYAPVEPTRLGFC